MNQNLDQRIATLKQQAAQAAQRQQQAAQAHAVAEDRASRVRQTMKEEFGVSTEQEAEVLLAKLESELQQKVSAAEEQLAKAVNG